MNTQCAVFIATSLEVSGDASRKPNIHLGS